MTKPFVAIVNVSTRWKDDDIAAYLPALQKHVSRDLAPEWGVDADLGFYVDHTAIPADEAWVVVVSDHTTQAGDLGFHDLTKAGLPMGHVFAADDLDCGEDPRRTLCHEIDEMLVDPHINGFTFASYGGKMVETVREICDPCQDSHCGYEIDGQPMADFVTKTYFDTTTHHSIGTKYDFTGFIWAPMTIAQGGYLSVKDPADGQGWRQEFGDRVPPHKLRPPPRYSRRERLFLRENHGRLWVPSTAI